MVGFMRLWLLQSLVAHWLNCAPSGRNPNASSNEIEKQLASFRSCSNAGRVSLPLSHCNYYLCRTFAHWLWFLSDVIRIRRPAGSRASFKIAHSHHSKSTKQQRWRTRPIWALAGRRSTPTMPMTKVRLCPCVVMHWMGPHLFIPLSVSFAAFGTREGPGPTALPDFELLHDFLAC